MTRDTRDNRCIGTQLQCLHTLYGVKRFSSAQFSSAQLFHASRSRPALKPLPSAARRRRLSVRLRCSRGLTQVPSTPVANASDSLPAARGLIFRLDADTHYVKRFLRRARLIVSSHYSRRRRQTRTANTRRERERERERDGKHERPVSRSCKLKRKALDPPAPSRPLRAGTDTKECPHGPPCRTPAPAALLHLSHTIPHAISLAISRRRERHLHLSHTIPHATSRRREHHHERRERHHERHQRAGRAVPLGRRHPARPTASSQGNQPPSASRSFQIWTLRLGPLPQVHATRRDSTPRRSHTLAGGSSQAPNEGGHQVQS